MSNINELINKWKGADFVNNVSHWENLPPSLAEMLPFPPDINSILKQAFVETGIDALYSHQLLSWNAIRSGKNVVVTTGTASGKTLCYNMPVIDSILINKDLTAIYLFPTKALTGDQLNKITNLINEVKGPINHHEISLIPAIYDGDTSIHERKTIRSKVNILLTNPDMLHIGILPHHTNWERIFINLRYIVIDEIHIYRGVLGSHLANVIRRLKRITQFYGSNPQFILTSATIANPSEFAEKLIEEPVENISKDGSAYGKRNIILYNPPIVNQELGLRNGIVSESVKIAEDLLNHNVQTIYFARTRKTVEITLKNLQMQYKQNANVMHGYRSGYLASERRVIEGGIRDGTIRAVVSTDALELGIDMGSVDAVLMMGFPGSIAAFRQQAGRAGRRQDASLAMLLASSSPLDQFIIQHPEFLFERSPENALINPNNPIILLAHLKCAAFELPFRRGDSFGKLLWDDLKPYLDFLIFSKDLFNRADRFLWMADAYPAGQISLRSASAQPILLQATNSGKVITIGEVDYESATWMVHPGAIYLHEGNSYLVRELNLSDHYVSLETTETDYYTEPKKDIEIEKMRPLSSEENSQRIKNLGDIKVTSKVTGFQKIQWFTREILGNETLDLPPSELRTIAYWLTLSDNLVNDLRQKNLWRNDKNIYGPSWEEMRLKARKRDLFTCQICGTQEKGNEHHVHHKIPFRSFTNFEQANQLENLITLCLVCHQRVEQNVRIRTGLSGLAYIMAHLAPIILMCDERDLGVYMDPQAKIADMKPTIVIYDQFPGGIGLSDALYQHDTELIHNAFELVNHCACEEGCPSCVGPAGENGIGGKEPVKAILSLLLVN